MQLPIKRVQQLRGIVCLLVEFPRNPVDMQNNLMFQAKPKELLGYLVKPNLLVAPVLDIYHILRVGLQIYLRPLAEREEGL